MKLDFSSNQYVDGFYSTTPVTGYTHSFYRYPARFSPQFVRSVIEAFSRPGDTVLDPFMGGGTSAVEALAGGRRFIGSDLNPLATFVTQVKTTPLTRRDTREIELWASSLNGRMPDAPPPADDECTRNVPWWLRKTVSRVLATTTTLSPVQAAFARCSILRAAQWALDCRKKMPTSQQFLSTHRMQVEDMLCAASRFRETLRSAKVRLPISRSRKLFTTSAANIHNLVRLESSWKAPKLVVTSPPYPGVHILYHRWQVEGRRETPAAYWIAGCRDGRGASFYTFAGRTRSTLDGYLTQLRTCFESIAKVINRDTVVAQIVAFSEPDTQLPAYLAVLQQVGLQHAEGQVYEADGLPIRRTVPNRKWYADVRGVFNSSREFLLIHRKA